MADTLTSFGLAIGWMDIFSSILSQIIIIFLVMRKDDNSYDELENWQKNSEAQVQELRTALQENKCIFITYLVLLNCWIIIATLMIYGIWTNTPSYIFPWLIWCLVGLIFDTLFMLWWFAELVTGDMIEAFTNILISVVTMAVEFMFFLVIYKIYSHMPSTDGVNKFGNIAWLTI